jgi:Tol biopolymer transport system component
LSGDGRYLAFESHATNLTTLPDSNDVADVFVRDRLTGTTRRVSIGRGGQEPNGRSGAPAISSDGRFVTFTSFATNLVVGEGTAGGGEVYVVGLANGDTSRVSIDAAGRTYAAAFAPRISGDGGLVVFTATARASERRHSRSGTTSGNAVYVRDIAAAVTTCVSCDAGTTGRQPAFAPDISVDGGIVVYTVLTGPDPQRTDIAVHDRSTSTTTVITRRGNARSAAARLSGDGRIVAFESWASDLLCDRHCSEEDIDDNLLPDVYLFDRGAARFRRLSGEHRRWWSPSQAPSIDGRGLTVVFSSRQPVGPEDATIDFDLYVCDPACR